MPTVIVLRVAPSLALSLVTLLPSKFPTQIFAPSKATALGAVPTVKVPRVEPSLALSLLTVLSCVSATQILAPSKATNSGSDPTEGTENGAIACPHLCDAVAELFTIQMLSPSNATPTGEFTPVNSGGQVGGIPTKEVNLVWACSFDTSPTALND
jgi:hypothetical protein